jgi:hypothetical protein
MASLFFCQDERTSVCVYECCLKHIQGFGHQDSTHTACSSAEMPPLWSMEGFIDTNKEGGREGLRER